MRSPVRDLASWFHIGYIEWQAKFGVHPLSMFVSCYDGGQLTGGLADFLKVLPTWWLRLSCGRNCIAPVVVIAVFCLEADREASYASS